MGVPQLDYGLCPVWVVVRLRQAPFAGFDADDSRADPVEAVGIAVGQAAGVALMFHDNIYPRTCIVQDVVFVYYGLLSAYSRHGGVPRIRFCHEVEAVVAVTRLAPSGAVTVLTLLEKTSAGLTIRPNLRSMI